MRDWLEEELAECQRHDARHMKRLAQPISRMPTACHGWAETVAASRFLDNPAMGAPEILSGHTRAPLERIRTPEVVWLVPDTTFLTYGTTQPKAGMGSGKIKTREESLLQPTGAFTPTRVTLGVVGMKVWPRSEQPVAQ